MILETLAALGSQAAGMGMTDYFNRRSQKRQMEFQQLNSDTAYQRSARDLEAAGLNRILALGNAASTPTGSAPTVGQGADIMGNVTSARQASSNIGLQAATTARTEQETARVAQEEKTSRSQEALNDTNRNIASAKLNGELLKLQAEYENLMSNSAKSTEETRLMASRVAAEIKRLSAAASLDTQKTATEVVETGHRKNVSDISKKGADVAHFFGSPAAAYRAFTDWLSHDLGGAFFLNPQEFDSVMAGNKLKNEKANRAIADWLESLNIHKGSR